MGGITNDYVPQECELGTLSNPDFGTEVTTTTVDNAIRKGWGVRQNNWEASASIQHELFQSVSVNFGYARRWDNHSPYRQPGGDARRLRRVLHQGADRSPVG